MVLGTCFIHHTLNIGILQGFTQFAYLALQIVLLTCSLDSCFGNLLHMSFLVLDMVVVVDFIVLYDLTGEGCNWHILAL